MLAQFTFSICHQLFLQTAAKGNNILQKIADTVRARQLLFRMNPTLQFHQGLSVWSLLQYPDMHTTFLANWKGQS